MTMKTQIRVIHYLSRSSRPPPSWRSNVWMSSRMVDGIESPDSACLACIPVTMALAPLTNGPNDVALVIARSVRERSEAKPLDWPSARG